MSSKKPDFNLCHLQSAYKNPIGEIFGMKNTWQGLQLYWIPHFCSTIDTFFADLSLHVKKKRVLAVRHFSSSFIRLLFHLKMLFKHSRQNIIHFISCAFTKTLLSFKCHFMMKTSFGWKSFFPLSFSACLPFKTFSILCYWPFIPFHFMFISPHSHFSMISLLFSAKERKKMMPLTANRDFINQLQVEDFDCKCKQKF